MRLSKTAVRGLCVAAACALAGSCGTPLEDALNNLVIQSNTTPIPLPDNAQPPTEYPSTITIAAPPGNLAAISVLVRVTHGRARDVDLVLVGPTGVVSLVMADCLGDSVLANDLLVFNATSTTDVPSVTTPPPIPSGAFRATNVADAVPDDDTFYPHASLPPAPYPADLSLFVGTNPNGVWRLYAKDDLAGGGGTGAVEAWQLWVTVQ
jgi:subtilisin-like proprotein convertase family protein